MQVAGASADVKACDALEARLEEAEAALRVATDAFEQSNADRDRLREALVSAEDGRREAEGRVRRLARAVTAVVDATGDVTDRASRLSSPNSPMRELQRAMGELEDAGLVTPARAPRTAFGAQHAGWAATSPTRSERGAGGDELGGVRRSALKSAERAAKAAHDAAEAREVASRLEAEWQAAEAAASPTAAVAAVEMTHTSPSPCAEDSKRASITFRSAAAW